MSPDSTVELTVSISAIRLLLDRLTLGRVSATSVMSMLLALSTDGQVVAFGDTTDFEDLILDRNDHYVIRWQLV